MKLLVSTWLGAAYLGLGMCWAKPAQAQVATAVVAGAAASSAATAATATQGEAVTAFVGSEPRDWLDPRTQTTSVLATSSQRLRSRSLPAEPT